MDAPAGMALRKVNEEVFVALDRVVRLGAEQVAFLKRQAVSNERKRARICAHRSTAENLHEMLIAISADSYIHPHKHLSKVESFHIVEGTVDVVIFDDAGDITEVIELGDASTGRNFYYRLSDGRFHTLVIRGGFLVVHEVTNGPFRKEDTILAPFAPPESRREEALAYMRALVLKLAARYARRS